MMGSPLWRDWESGDSIPLSLLRGCVLFAGLLFLGFTGVLTLGWPQQALVALLTIAVAAWLDRSSSSYLVTLTLMLLSVYSTFRYGFWRVVTTMGYFRDPHSHWQWIDAFFMGMLLLSECYAFVVLLLGYLQTVWPLRRTPVPLPDDTAEWPAVDVLIPTLNEPLDVVRFTALAAMNMDWPADRLNVYILDDGRRQEFREFAEEAGVGYMTRENNSHAKAGNLNAALARLDSPFVVVFDSDHVPTRSFLQMTLGWFLRDSKLGILQTPHHFYSPDPFDRNLGQFRTIPNEDELFYGVVQDGNDFWNATYFCGSCAVLRRSALDEVGGMATDTVTEDAHTSLRMQQRGWNSAYINIPQAAGLATERLSGHVRQRIRWARGMVQILRVDNPLVAPGLTLTQRLCYFNSMSYFLYALPRLIFLTAPLMYLIFGYTNIPGSWMAILAYAAPHLVLSKVTNSRMQGAHRHSFWNEIYETVLAPYLFLPTLMALIRPRSGRFDVTSKGSVVDEEFFDVRIARPTLVLLSCNWFGLCCMAPRLLQFPAWNVPVWASFVNWPATLYDPSHVGTIWINASWTVFNIMLLGVAAAVAWESQQRRRAVRVETSVPSEVVLADGSIVRGVTADLSSSGVRTTLEYDVTASPGDEIRFVFPVLDGTVELPATVIQMSGQVLRARFRDLNLEELEALTMILYSRADRWLGWDEAREPDHPVRSLLRIIRIALRGLRQTVFGPGILEEETPKRGWATSIAPLVIALMLAGLGERTAGGAQGSSVQSEAKIEQALFGTKPVEHPPEAFNATFSLADAGVKDSIVLRGLDSRRSVTFSIPQNELVKTASLRVQYRFSPGLVPAASQLKVSLNGTPVGTIAVTARQAAPGRSRDLSDEQNPGPASKLSLLRSWEQGPTLQATLELPPDILARSNQLTFEFVGHYGAECEDPAHTTLWSRVETSSTVELAGTLIPLQDDLALLPLPFYQAGLTAHPVVPIVFSAKPSKAAMQAAGIVSSWFGTLSDSRPIQFPVTIGTIPRGNAVVIAESAAWLPTSLHIGTISGPMVAIRTNPSDQNGKVLILTGQSGSDLVKAAISVATNKSALQGAQVMPAVAGASPARSLDDAPRWLSTETGHTAQIGASADGADLQGDGTQPAAVYLRMPPDLYQGETARDLTLHVDYRYNGAAVGDGSALQVWMNGSYVSSIALAKTSKVTTVRDAMVQVPASSLRPFSNTLMLRFAFRPATDNACVAGAAVPPSFSGTILPETYLDVQGMSHWTALPNLELFANAGYPFTRRSDLADTVVVMPEQPSQGELELFLGVMGHFGTQTGVPVTNVTVSGPSALTSGRRKDFLVLGTVEDQPGLRTAAGVLPVTLDEAGVKTHDVDGPFGHGWMGWWRVRAKSGAKNLLISGTAPDALIEGAEWPRGSGRSVVIIALHSDAAAGGFLSAFLERAKSSDVSESVSLLHGGQFVSYRAGSAQYMVGQLPRLTRLNMLLAQFPWIIVLAAVLFCFLMASMLRVTLRRGARMRLQGSA